MRTYDFVIVGSGIAGLSFALKASQHGTVAIVTKRAGEESNTNYAQGGIACVTSDEDSFELHVKDTLEAGAGLCDEAAVRAIVTDGPERIRELIEIGVHFDERDVGEGGGRELDLGREGGHSKRRVLHARDMTGREIESALIRAVKANPDISVLENHTAVDLITTAKLGYVTGDRCVGALRARRSGPATFTRCVRTGSSSPPAAAGRCISTPPTPRSRPATAWPWPGAPGATIANMEFIQFHPTCLYHPEARSFLISEAVRGEGGRLVDAAGREFMAEVSPAGRPRAARHRGPRHRCRDEAHRRALRVPRHQPQARGFHPGAFSEYLRNLPALRHRHHHTADSRRARSPLPVRRGSSRP